MTKEELEALDEVIDDYFCRYQKLNDEELKTLKKLIEEQKRRG